jgi:MFS transporter, ACS family, hexuronate transporter
MGFVSAIPWLVGFLGLSSSGFVCDAIYRRSGNALYARKLILISSLLIAAVCVALAGIASSVVLVVALMAVSVFFMYLTASTYWAIVLDTVEAPRVGGVGGFVHLVANLAGIVAPMVTGYLIEWTGSFASAFVLTGAIAVLGALSVAIFVRQPTVELATSRLRPATLL